MIFFPVQQACTGECTKHSESIIRNSFAGTERLCLIELSRRHLPSAFAGGFSALKLLKSGIKVEHR